MKSREVISKQEQVQSAKNFLAARIENIQENPHSLSNEITRNADRWTILPIPGKTIIQPSGTWLEYIRIISDPPPELGFFKGQKTWIGQAVV